MDPSLSIRKGKKGRAPPPPNPFGEPDEPDEASGYNPFDDVNEVDETSFHDADIDTEEVSRLHRQEYGSFSFILDNDHSLVISVNDQLFTGYQLLTGRGFISIANVYVMFGFVKLKVALYVLRKNPITLVICLEF